MDKINILAIETSCDETAAAVIGEKDDQPVILSNIISSQIDLHAKTGGVVPEVASRAHVESIIPVILASLENSNSQSLKPKEIPNYNSLNIKNSDLDIISDLDISALDLLKDITHIAVTAGPGLIGSLLVGFNTAKSISYARNLPIIPINHIEGHIYSGFTGEFPISNTPEGSPLGQFPIISLTVSGGHTSLTLMTDHGKYETIGETIDDAVGEAYDKVAKLLDLGYPGGPVVSKFAASARSGEAELRRSGETGRSFSDPQTLRPSASQPLVFPRPIINDGTFNFSFSGLKTAVLQKTIEIKKDHEITEADKLEICYAFEEAVAEVLCTKLGRAIDKYSPKAVIFAGGVSANGYLRERLSRSINDKQLTIDFLTPQKDMYGDNAAMIGLAAYYHIKRGDIKKWNEIHVDSNMDLT